MLTAQRDSIRLLHGILVASVALPAALFVYASWLGYHNNRAVADRQIDRTRDVVTEHVKHRKAAMRDRGREVPGSGASSSEIRSILNDARDEKLTRDSVGRILGLVSGMSLRTGMEVSHAAMVRLASQRHLSLAGSLYTPPGGATGRDPSVVR